MAATSPAKSPKRAASKPKQVARTTKRAASTTKRAAKTSGRAAKPTTALARPSSAVSRILRKAARTLARKGLRSGVDAARTAAETTLELARDAAGRAHRSGRLPIQCSVDVAVPLRVAWEEWTALDSLPEGIQLVEQIERGRDGHMTGRGAAPRSSNWAAEILDERDCESFAWQSVQGSDCAGLATFHELGERLTRIELNLDVVPNGVLEALLLSSRLADRRAEADLRRFKARLELINPDRYQ